MRIVLACRVFDHQAGGMPHVVQDRAEELARQGHDVHVLTTAKDGNSTSASLRTCSVGWGREPSPPFTVHYLNCPPRQYSSAYAVACANICSQLNPKIIHLDSFDRERQWWKYGPAINTPPVVAITMHGFGPGAFLTEWNKYRCGRGPIPYWKPDDLLGEASALAKADVTIGVGLEECWYMRSWYGLRNVNHVPNPIAQYFFDDPPAPCEGHFLCAGSPSTSENRGFDLAEKAAAKIGAKLKIVRDVPRRNMPAEYDRCRALVLPTLWSQGYDLCVAEALARRRFVIVSDVGNYGRATEIEKNICTFPAGDVDELAKIMQGTTPSGQGFRERYYYDHAPAGHVHNWLEAIGI